MYLNIDNFAAPIPMALLADRQAVQRAVAAAAPMPTEDDLQAQLNALGDHGDDSQGEPLEPADLRGPQPTDEERQEARYSRDRLRSDYIRRGVAAQFARG